MGAIEKTSAVVIGAGVVGLAVARALAEKGHSPLILESGPRIAEGVTSRNSGVIHAGLYYPRGSLKLECCLRGNRLLYEWCGAKGVPHRKIGKWVVAAAGRSDELRAFFEAARANGALGLSWANSAQVQADSPGVLAEAGVFSAETGVIDPAELSASLAVAAEERGGQLVVGTRVSAIERAAGGGYRLDTSRGEIGTELVVNAAGLHADEIAAMAGMAKYKIYPCRGDYFTLRMTGVARRRHVYPMKKKGAPGLGVHLTVGVDGSFRLGPDAEYVASKSNFSDPCAGAAMEAKRRAFFEAAAKYLAGIQIEQLAYDSCGLRPKLRAPTDPEERDFVVAQDLPGFINLVGIESPGLTASLALAERVVAML